MKKLKQKRLKELLDYNPETGIFTWKVNRGSNFLKGTVAGCFSHGYIQIGIDNKLYGAHRLAWLYMKGYFPENDIDHIDRIKHHNWISNLREISTQCNRRNTGNLKNSSSGVKGVTWCIPCKKWSANITINRKAIYLGRYTDFTEAVCHRLAAEQCLNWDGCDSSSPAYQYVKEILSKLTNKYI